MTLLFVDLFSEREHSLKTVTGALEKYLEQPHLLDPHLEDMMAVVMGRAKELVVKREEEVLAGSGGGSRGRPGEAFPFQVNVRMLTGCCRGFFARDIVCPTKERRKFENAEIYGFSFAFCGVPSEKNALLNGDLAVTWGYFVSR